MSPTWKNCKEDTCLNSALLMEQYNLLKDKQSNPNITWDNITWMRYKHTGNIENPDTIRKGAKLFYEYLDAGWISPPQETTTVKHKTVSLKGTGEQTSDCTFAYDEETDYQNPTSLLELHGYNPKLFELQSASSSFWGSEDNPMVSSKIAVRPKEQLEPTSEDLTQWMESLPSYLSSTPHHFDIRYDQDAKLLVIPISDLHFNLRSSALQCGEEYNIEIAKRVFFACISNTLHKVKDEKIEKIVFLIGGDMQNADNLAGTTTKGTPQDNCLDYFSACEELYNMVICGIETMLNIAPVHVMYVPGNHDKVTGYKLAKYIQAWYRNDKSVSVDASPVARKYYIYGDTLLVFAHDADVKRLPELIADEARDYWSDITNTDVYLQHLHTEAILSERNHMRIQRLPSMSGLSAWAAEKGYRSTRQHQSFLYGKHGRELIIYTY